MIGRKEGNGGKDEGNSCKTGRNTAHRADVRRVRTARIYHEDTVGIRKGGRTL